MSFSNLKKSRKTNFSKLTEEIEKLNTTSKGSNGNNADNRFWKLTVDKAGNGHAGIRFLSAPKGEDIPWVRVWDHGFQGPGGWYIENSLTTLGKKDPVSEYNSKLWNSGVESNKDVARKQKRRLSHFSNIYVVSDSANPDNDGKVFLFKFGKKIFDKLSEIMTPGFDDETPMNPFAFWKGANFKLKIRKVDGFWNYDKSEFEAASELYDGEDTKLEGLYGNLHGLKQFLETDNFKSYDDLKTKLNRVLTGSSVVGTVETFSSPKPKKAETEIKVEEEDKDETLSYFAKLADED